MKKVIIGLSGLVILLFVVILFINAQNNSQEVKKTGTEISAKCGKCPSASTCIKTGDTKTAKCDPAKCKEAGCDKAKSKEGKCDQTAGKMNCCAAKGETKTSDATSASCATSCPMKSTEKTK
jgi:hypothetical protein